MVERSSQLGEEFLSQNNVIRKTYLRDKNGRKALHDVTNLLHAARLLEVDPRINAHIFLTKASIEYNLDISGETSSNRSYLSAKQGLDLLIKPEEDHEVRSKLLRIAGLCQLNIIKEQDEPAEPLLRKAAQEAEFSKKSPHRKH